jgi:hypothetical protein
MWICIIILILILLYICSSDKEHFTRSCGCQKQRSHQMPGREFRMFDALTYDLNDATRDDKYFNNVI